MNVEILVNDQLLFKYSKGNFLNFSSQEMLAIQNSEKLKYVKIASNLKIGVSYNS